MFNRDFPKMQEYQAYPWKKQTAFIEWTSRIMTHAKGIHSMIGKYMAHCLRGAEEHFVQRRGKPADNVLPLWQEVDNKLVAACLEALPKRISDDCHRTNQNTSLTVVLYNLYTLINPGGARELELLMDFCRQPWAEEETGNVRLMVEEWIVARRRLILMTGKDLIPKERVDALALMVRHLCQKDPKFKLSWDTRAALLGPGCHDHADEKYAEETEEWLRNQLKGMENDELMRRGKQEGAKDRYGVGAGNVPVYQAVVGQAQEAVPPVPKPRDGLTAQERKKNFKSNFACHQWKKFGTCNREIACIHMTLTLGKSTKERGKTRKRGMPHRRPRR